MDSQLRIVFAGTPEFAVPCLKALCKTQHQIVGVYTQPDRPAGRGRQLTMSPVKKIAIENELPIFQPETLKTIVSREQLRALQPDLMVVVAYGLILPPKVLSIPRMGCWNVHASLLPRWRGAAPIQRAILADDYETGVCLMQIEVGLDTGPVLLTERTLICAVDTSQTLHDRLAQLGANMLMNGLECLCTQQEFIPHAQATEGVSYAAKLHKQEAILDLKQSAATLERQVRAFNPWPIAEIQLAGERLRIFAAQVQLHVHTRDFRPGDVLAIHREGVDVACGKGVLRLITVQRAGGKPMSAFDWAQSKHDLLPRI